MDQEVIALEKRRDTTHFLAGWTLWAHQVSNLLFVLSHSIMFEEEGEGSL
jgi:hypothetical protein